MKNKEANEIVISKSFGIIIFIFIFFPQRFSRCILQPSSDVPCLSRHRNDSTWEITIKVSQVESLLSQNKQGTPEEGRRIQRLKRCEKNNKDEDNSLKTLTDKKHQASFQKSRQQLKFVLGR